MSAVTVLLLVLIVSLGIGNALFFFMKKRNSAPVARQTDIVQPVQAPQAVASSAAAVHLQVQAPLSLAPMEQKIELAHARLQALESRVKSMQGIYGENLKVKIEKLESFRDTANAEIIALKEIVDGLQKKGSNEDVSRRNRAKEKQITDQELRKLIYRSSA